MPVDEAFGKPHILTKRASDDLYGCHNHPPYFKMYKSGHGEALANTASGDCHHSEDVRCGDCNWRAK